ncbi:MAG: ABC transporter ATP-binding protein [Thermomicrobiales bacterium]|nr:ABC transporter ATP-binding protein [Thermomicrobiales bacterium]
MDTRDLRLVYGERTIVNDLTVSITEGAITAIAGPNGCGKSTLLRSIARLMKPAHGAVLLNGQDIHQQSTREVARQLAMLPQSSSIPNGITVVDLVGYGRYPHQGLLRSPSRKDRDVIEWAIDVTGLNDLRDRTVDTLSGGERQRAWIALALAQESGVLLLDEPTTFLDVRYQLEVLSLVRRLNAERGITVGWVLHDLNQAAAFSDHIIMLRDGEIAVQGSPLEVMTPAAIGQVFGIDVSVIPHPLGQVPMCLPNAFCPLVSASFRDRSNNVEGSSRQVLPTPGGA